MNDPSSARSLLLVATCHRDHDRAGAAWQRLSREHHRDESATLAWLRAGSEQRLLALLGQRADQLGLGDEMVEACHEATAIAWGLNERIFAEVARVLGAWRSAGIDVLCFKGLGLIGDVYPQHHLRPVGDADLLVRPGDVRPAIDIMERLGWRIPRGLRFQYRRGMSTENLGNGTGVSIDLHQHPARTMPEERGRLPAAWDGAQPVPDSHPLAATGLGRPAPVQHALILATHHARLANRRVAHVAADLHRMFVMTPELQSEAAGLELARAAQREYLADRIGAALRSLHALLETPIPASARAMAPASEPERRAEQRAADAERRIEAAGDTNPALGRLRDYVAVSAAGLGPMARLHLGLRVITTWAAVRLR